MRFSRMSVLFFAVAMAWTIAPARAADLHHDEKAADRELAAMHWSTGTQKLTESHGTFTVPVGGSMVKGSEAARADAVINGEGNGDSEGVVFLKHRTLYLQYNDSGFVNTDDWKDFDAAKLLQDMTDATSEANKERTQHGVPELHVDGWVQKPTFDAQRKIVRWVVGLHSADGRLVNAVALEVGRHGYERFTLVSDGKDPSGDAAMLAASAKNYTFDRGFRFSDYVSGDKLASYGLAALVGTAAGTTIAKTVGFAAILLFIKKFFILILAGLAAVFSRLKNVFKRDKATFGPPQGTPES